MASVARPRALLIAPESPYPAAGGGALRTASLIEYLARKYDLDLVVFREPAAADPRRVIPPGLFRRLLVLELAPHSRSLAPRIVRTAGRLARGVPPLSDRFAGFKERLREFISGQSYELGVIEHIWCAGYLEVIERACRRTVLDLHNIESVLMARRAAVAPFPASSVFRRFERAARAEEQLWLGRFTTVLVTSAHDASIARRLADGAEVVIYPNALPLRPRPEEGERHMVAFSGNLEYDPNLDAVRFFSRRMWPHLAAGWPQLRWRLIGSRPEAAVRYVRNQPRVEFVCAPQDAVQALAQAQAVVVPLRIGSGTRFKILEAWAAARAVVSTAVGAEGLPARDGENILIRDEPGEFVRAVSDLLGSAELRRRLGGRGRSLFEQEFTWEAAWRRLFSTGI